MPTDVEMEEVARAWVGEWGWATVSEEFHEGSKIHARAAMEVRDRQLKSRLLPEGFAITDGALGEKIITRWQGDAGYRVGGWTDHELLGISQEDISAPQIRP